MEDANIVTCLRMPRSLKDELHEYAKANDLSASQVIRKAIRLYINNKT